MNILRKIYCRAFQGVFKIAIPFLPYRNPMVLRTVSEIPHEIKIRNIKNVLIVTDNYISTSGLLTSLENELYENGINVFLYDKTVANPTVENVENARSIYIENNGEAIIGFGGGSSIDCAKAVGARIAKPIKSIQQMEGILKILKKTPFTVAVPTTAGTGSETTLATVITDEATRHKFPINDFVLIPDVAVLDPELTKSLPKNLTASTGMDALTHAVEAYIGNSTVPSTEEAAIKATKLIFENLYDAYSDGNNLRARKNMLVAAFFAGNAFSKSYVGYCHAAAHSLGGKYNIPHGLANAVLLPYTLELYGESVYNKLKKLAVAAEIVSKDVSEKDAAEIFIEKIRDMNRRMNIPDKLSGIHTEDIPKLAEYADREANPLYPVPKLMNKKELEALYFAVMEENK